MDHSPETHANADGEEADDEEKIDTRDQVDSMQLEKHEMDTEREFDYNENDGNNRSPQLSVENVTEDSKSPSQGQYIEAPQPGDQQDGTVLWNKEISAKLEVSLITYA